MSGTDDGSLPVKFKATAEAVPGAATKAKVTGAGQTGQADWLRPISALEPCGPNLEYDPEYAVLMARLAPQADAQYGSFVDKPDLPDWAEIERECRRLLLRSKDINLLIWLMRCRARLGGAAGLRDVLTMLTGTLERYPDDVHPQREIEGAPDPEVRANALAALADPLGLLSDVRELVVSASTAFRLTVKDIERAFAVPRVPDALPADSVRQQLEDLRWQHNPQFEALRDSGVLLRRIDHWSQAHLGGDAPALQPVLRLLAAFAVEDEKATQAALEVPYEAVATSGPESVFFISAGSAVQDTPMTAASPPAVAFTSTVLAPSLTIGTQGNIAAQREQVRAYIREAREWLEQHEPSSPVAILLKQAERLVGKRFAEVAQAIPPDLLAKWDAE